MSITFKLENPGDMDYYVERASEIIRNRGFEYLTTNSILHKIRDFVQEASEPVFLEVRESELEIKLGTEQK